MNRIDRLSAILIPLPTNRVTKAQKLAGQFGTSPQTIYGDVREVATWVKPSYPVLFV